MNHRSGHDVDGLMFIGDPHLEGRVPGFRKDEYPVVALEKFRWCLKEATAKNLQPILLGDLFHLPQDNPNWLVSEIIEIIATYCPAGLPAIYGNHDVRENTRKPNDSVSILFAGGHLRLLSDSDPWTGRIDGKSVLVGGTVWGDRLPKCFPMTEETSPSVPLPDLVAWITHHDILIPGYEESGRIRPSHLPGIDVIINGHVHRRLEPVVKAGTLWVTAGNITRRTRGDASRSHTPAVVCLVRPDNATVPADGGTEPLGFESHGGTKWALRWVRVPHRPFDEVFHPETQSDGDESDVALESGFIADLRELTERRTDSGAGLMAYLENALPQFEPAIAEQIMLLANEVTQSEPS